RGREDRVYCRYNLNTIDNIENRILKAALHQARRIVERFFTAGIATEALRSSMVYCEHALRDVRKQPVSARDFSAVRTTGFHAYYKPVITLGRLLLERGTISEQPAP